MVGLEQIQIKRGLTFNSFLKFDARLKINKFIVKTQKTTFIQKIRKESCSMVYEDQYV